MFAAKIETICLSLMLALTPVLQAKSSFKRQSANQAETQVLTQQLKAEIDDLKTKVLQKIDSDMQTTSFAFAESENILRSLRIAYPLKAVLDIVADAFSIVESLNDLKDLIPHLRPIKTALALNTIYSAVNNAWETGNNLHFALDGHKYVDSVERMLTAAKNQPKVLGIGSFDKDLYQKTIENWLLGIEGENIVNIAHKFHQYSCQDLRGTADIRRGTKTIKGIKQLKLYVIRVFNDLRNYLNTRNLSLQETANALAHIKRIKTLILESKKGNASVSYQSPRKQASGSCELSDVRVQLGLIAGHQIVLQWAYGAEDKNLSLEQDATLSAAADSMSSVVTIYAGKTRLTELTSAFSTGAEIGQFLIEDRFKTTARDEIVSRPQQMLLSLSEEFSNLLVVLDDLKLVGESSSSPKGAGSSLPTLFLIDTSGSMSDNNKIEQARAAALDALSEIRANVRRGAGQSPLAVLSFAGPCSANSTRKLSDFTTDLNQAEAVVRRGLPSPDGETPSPQAVSVSISEMRAYLDRHTETPEGRIVLLSDGQSTCGDIRPPDVYSRRTDITIGRGDQLSGALNQSRIKFLTIGFDVRPGSAAERDLQYLASVSGGKYFNAPDRRQLTRAFQKFIQVFIPKKASAMTLADAAALAEFERGRQAMLRRDYPEAIKAFKTFLALRPNDPAGLYNLALALEAMDHYKGAAEFYRRYLSTSSGSVEQAELQQHILQMEQDYVDQFKYYLEVLRSDLAYLKNYYQTLFHRRNDDLAREFAGFIQEKGEFYAALPDILELNARWLDASARDLSDSLSTLAQRVRQPTFDRDAVSLLTLPIGQLEEIIERAEKLGPQISR